MVSFFTVGQSQGMSPQTNRRSTAPVATIDEPRRTTLTDLGEVSDEQLVAWYKEGDHRAMEELLDRFRGYARVKVRSYFLAGADKEDVVQEGMIGLYKAIRDFDPERETSFSGFAEVCITRQIITAV